MELRSDDCPSRVLAGDLAPVADRVGSAHPLRPSQKGASQAFLKLEVGCFELYSPKQSLFMLFSDVVQLDV